MSRTHHLAALQPSKGNPLTIQNLPTPAPGPGELLMQVSSIALNPIDVVQLDTGFSISAYPAILGSDIAGTVLSTNPSTASPFKVGTRVIALAPAFYQTGTPKYGGYQERVIVPLETICPIPDDLSFNAAVVLPMCVATAWSGFYRLEIPRGMKYSATEKRGFLVWGAASSVGTGAVQLARSMGFHVYVTASLRHHAYLEKLGASRTFEYQRERVVERIISAAREDGVSIQHGFDAVGSVGPCVEILEKTGNGSAKLATARRFGDVYPGTERVEVIFVKAPEESKAQAEHFEFIFNHWLKEKLDRKEWIPSPKVELVQGGLESINSGLDRLRKGVSGVKLVLEI